MLRARLQKDKRKGSVMVKSECSGPTQESFIDGPAKRKGRDHTENVSALVDLYNSENIIDFIQGATHVVLKSEVENLRAVFLHVQFNAKVRVSHHRFGVESD